jgi:hypothetical protein
LWFLAARRRQLRYWPPFSLSNIGSPCTLLEIRVLQGFFTNTYNKPYPIGFFTLWKNPKGFSKNPLLFLLARVCYMCWWKLPEEPLFLRLWPGKYLVLPVYFARVTLTFAGLTDESFQSTVPYITWATYFIVSAWIIIIACSWI